MCCDFRAFCLSCYHAPRRPIFAMRTSRSHCVLRVARAWARRPDHPPVVERVTGTPHFARRDASYGGREDNPPSTIPQCASTRSPSRPRWGHPRSSRPTAHLRDISACACTRRRGAQNRQAGSTIRASLRPTRYARKGQERRKGQGGHSARPMSIVLMSASFSPSPSASSPFTAGAS